MWHLFETILLKKDISKVTIHNGLPVVRFFISFGRSLVRPFYPTSWDVYFLWFLIKSSWWWIKSTVPFGRSVWLRPGSSLHVLFLNMTCYALFFSRIQNNQKGFSGQNVHRWCIEINCFSFWLILVGSPGWARESFIWKITQRQRRKLFSSSICF